MGAALGEARSGKGDKDGGDLVKNGGIPSSAILRLIDRWALEDVNIYGFELRRGGAVRTRGAYAPFAGGEAHRVYSVSKSMTALAVGLMVGEGKLDLDAPVVRYFADMLPEQPDARLVRLTVRDMLRMAACYEKTTYREGIDSDWTAAFFRGRAAHEPGTVFAYDTSCSQVLGALVERLSGQGLLELLQERVFSPIGACGEKRFLTDPSGAPQAGTGLIMTLEDLGKTAQLVMDGGRGLIPADFIAEATRRQIDTSMRSSPEERFGYGWQFWMTRSGFAMYGMGGQMAICCPREGTILCTVADTRLDPCGVQRIYDAFYDEIIAHLDDADTPEDAERLNRRLQTLSVGAVKHGGFAMLPPGTWRALDGGALRGLAVGEKSVRLLWKGGEHAFFWDAWGSAKQGCFLGVPCLTLAGMTDRDVLCVRCHLLGDAPCGMEMLLTREGERMTLGLRRSADPLTAGYDGTYELESVPPFFAGE